MPKSRSQSDMSHANYASLRAKDVTFNDNYH